MISLLPHGISGEQGIGMDTPEAGSKIITRRKVLFGTTNEAKIEHVRAYLKALPVEILSPKDLHIDIDVAEDGQTPEENAAKKAQAYYAAARIPTFAIDAGLRIEKFSEENQPGVYVRRVSDGERSVPDEEILEHYRKGLEEVGGISPGTWYVAVSFVASAGQEHTQLFTLETLMTSEASDSLIPGAPLSSLMKDPPTGRYYSEMAYEERPDLVLIAGILKEDLEKLWTPPSFT
jgi:inosine/xanthosine triphosphate pyrophosphatase family protein